MLSPLIVIMIFCSYMGLLFLLALLVEKKAGPAKLFSNNAVIYSLSLAVYCTTWTYYGSVGKAATSGMDFVPIFLGPTLAILFWWIFLRKLIRIKNIYRITSIADFLSARYNKSHVVAAVGTTIALFVAIPYVALQFKAIFSTFDIIVQPQHTNYSHVITNIDPIVVGLMIIFTIIFGIRRLDPTERHKGIVGAVAVESIVKLIAFLTAGIFVTYFMFNGFGDIFKQFATSPFYSTMHLNGSRLTDLASWNTSLLLSISAILFLPRQFHVSVIENYDEKHIRTALWMFPLYLFLINIFVFPIAVGGLLKGFSIKEADRFVLLMPLHYGKPWLALLVFIGGFSAATSMIMISSMTMSTMITNHYLLPLMGWFKKLNFLQKHLLRLRWLAVAFVISIGYLFERYVGGTYMLSNIGTISFVAALQFAPAIIGGIFWKRANRTGAILGMSSGFCIWLYTMFIPSFGRHFFENGPWGIKLLHPEHILGLPVSDPVVHSLFWSMLANIGFYVLGSLYFPAREDEQKLAEQFAGILSPTRSPLSHSIQVKPTILLARKRAIIEQLLENYFHPDIAHAIYDKALSVTGVSGKELISVTELADLHTEIEKTLSGSIGAAAAHKALKTSEIFTKEEDDELSSIYGEMLANLKITPEELKKKIDFYNDRESLLTKHAGELEEKVRELETQIQERRKAEEKIRYLSYYDKLTGLYNRAYFEEELKRLNTPGFLPLSVIMGDANNLKLANDAFGHLEGDKLLITLATILKKCCRKADSIGRWGGDEFIILLPNTDERYAMEVARRVRKECKETKTEPFQPSIALGIATKDAPEQDFNEILREAEDRMYRNKLLENRSGRNAIITSLLNTLKERSHETEQHTKRLLEMAMRMGRFMNLSDDQMDELALLSVLHDVGKISIPDEILMKAGPLNEKEWRTMIKHAEAGYRIAHSFSALTHIADAIFAHHERWDGSGYPQGLKGTEIPLISRILSIVDAYDVMTHERSYKKAMSHIDAIEELKKNSGSQFDPALIEIFIKLISEEQKDITTDTPKDITDKLRFNDIR